MSPAVRRVVGAVVGAVAIMVALLAVVIFGIAAYVIDISALYQERRELQNGADAAALAIARDCAMGDCGDDYATADEVLWLLFDEGLTPDEIVERGYDAPVVRRIVQFERQFRFKRRLMLIARLSGSAVNLDQEIPRD